MPDLLGIKLTDIIPSTSSLERWVPQVGMAQVMKMRVEMKAEIDQFGCWSVNADDSTKTHGKGTKIHVVEVSTMGWEDGNPNPVPKKRCPDRLRNYTSDADSP